MGPETERFGACSSSNFSSRISSFIYALSSASLAIWTLARDFFELAECLADCSLMERLLLSAWKETLFEPLLARRGAAMEASELLFELSTIGLASRFFLSASLR